MKHFVCLFLVLSAALAGQSMAQNDRSLVTGTEWDRYSGRFVTAEGRVLDDANAGISHSEGQGYGLLLAEMADSQADFDRIWAFTRDELLLRDDGLAAWKWEADASPHVTDINNATDGDILIAYALARAGERWGDAQYTDAAADLAGSIAEHAVLRYQGRVLLMPAVDGFGVADRADGPVINPSYWVFEAFPVLERLAPDGPWQELARTGRDLIAHARFSDRRLPAEWLSVAGIPRPAQGFKAEFGYNALRIPLYMMRGGMTEDDVAMELGAAIRDADGNLVLVDLGSGEPTETLTDAGYRILAALGGCVANQTPLAPDLRDFEPTVYYPSTLHLLSLAFVREAAPECLQ
ncbi:endoglucanase [Aliihoeflea aestuarii]|jgi:endoglucanase|uniref:glycosyl hydrolase family 8 n=1 Tax=Aliihoeflea aestuarii TaxID=453840 RepID=UPI00209276E7|nr:glycosyl hydrolase family 8 [Aliihoeflea aestuarii]MCO6392020.1 endoglucanase [Aliihoeflea aestuarii]